MFKTAMKAPSVAPITAIQVLNPLASVRLCATALIWLGEAARLAMANSMRSMPKGDGATMRPLVLDDNLLSCARIINREGIMVAHGSADQPDRLRSRGGGRRLLGCGAAAQHVGDRREQTCPDAGGSAWGPAAQPHDAQGQPDRNRSGIL